MLDFTLNVAQQPNRSTDNLNPEGTGVTVSEPPRGRCQANKLPSPPVPWECRCTPEGTWAGRIVNCALYQLYNPSARLDRR